jgi:SAM-dependent methyltransferase
VQEFFSAGHLPAFDTLYQQVNSQVLAPLFKPFLTDGDPILDAGCGSGQLASLLGLRRACAIDLSFEQIQTGRRKEFLGSCAQSDLSHLPFEAETFASVICANVLHYAGFPGLQELHRITKADGRLLLAFLERSDYTRWVIETSVFLGLFPAFMRDVPLLDIADLHQLNMVVEDSYTVAYLAPWYIASRSIPRKGLVVYVLRKIA